MGQSTTRTLQLHIYNSSEETHHEEEEWGRMGEIFLFPVLPLPSLKCKWKSARGICNTNCQSTNEMLCNKSSTDTSFAKFRNRQYKTVNKVRDGIWVPSSSFLVTLYFATSCTPYLHITGHWSSGQAWDLSDLTPYATTCMLDTREETIIHLVK